LKLVEKSQNSSKKVGKRQKSSEKKMRKLPLRDDVNEILEKTKIAELFFMLNLVLCVSVCFFGSGFAASAGCDYI
jgi:hypothetical protein